MIREFFAARLGHMMPITHTHQVHTNATGCDLIGVVLDLLSVVPDVPLLLFSSSDLSCQHLPIIHPAMQLCPTIWLADLITQAICREPTVCAQLQVAGQT